MLRMAPIHVPSRRPEDWRRLLADPKRHWRVGFSAYEVAHSWQRTERFPQKIAAALATSPFGSLELLFGFPEHKVAVPGRGGDSATDLFVLGRSLEGDLVAIALEGKVDESFDQPVRKWLDDPRGDSENRVARLEGLARILELDPTTLDGVPYQLLHRAAVACLEAQRFKAKHAVLLVQSFSAEHAHLDDYRSFAALFNAGGEPDVVDSVGQRGSVELHLCWVADAPRKQAHNGEPESVLLEALEWLKATYREHRFFKERDVEAVLQARMTELFEERRVDWRVYENHRVSGKRLDLAVADRHRPADVMLGIELKYEPEHARAGGDIRGDTEKLPVCLREELIRDVQQVQRCVKDGLIKAGYALLLDEGGYWRYRQKPPPGTCQLWGKDTIARKAPALFLSRFD